MRTAICPKTEAQLFDMLAEVYCEPRYVLLPHVANATGWKRQRTADAVAFEMWPMDGLHLVGFEIKSTRSDWLREVKRPVKREAVAQFCDQWVVVAAGPGIVRTAELRPGEGLMVAREGGLRMEVEPSDVPAAPVSREFLMAAVRRALACSPHGQAVAARAKELADAKLSKMSYELQVAKHEAQRLRVRLEDLQARPVLPSGG